MSRGLFDIPGYQGRYFIDRESNIFSMNSSWKRLHKLKGHHDRGGYIRVTLYDTPHNPHNWLLHRLVAITFLPNPNNLPTVNHINSIRDDNRIENLEWCSRSDNTIHGMKYGRIVHPRGEMSTAPKLNNSLVKEIKLLLASGMYSQRNIAQHFAISQATVSMIHTKRSWEDVSI